MFDVYAKPNDYYRAVSYGFNIFPYCLTFLWLLSKRMYVLSVIYACLAFMLWAVLGTENYGYLTFVLSLVPGFYANSLWAWHLKHKGYKRVATIEANSTADAIKKYLKHLKQPLS
jgi:hypothetical protein